MTALETFTHIPPDTYVLIHLCSLLAFMIDRKSSFGTLPFDGYLTSKKRDNSVLQLNTAQIIKFL